MFCIEFSVTVEIQEDLGSKYILHLKIIFMNLLKTKITFDS